MTSQPQSLLIPGADAASGEERWNLGLAIAHAIRARYPAEVLAIGAHGSLAHGDDREGSDVELTVVTYRPQTGPAPTSREIGGWIVQLGVLGAEEYLYHARTLTTRWPLIADQYLNTKPLIDQMGWHQRLRDHHLARLVEAQQSEFTDLARKAWCTASSLYRRAARSTEWFDTDGALMLLAEARCAAALVEGLLTRTYYRSGADAGRRTGIGALDLGELHTCLDEQAARLADRGKSVAGAVSDLV